MNPFIRCSLVLCRSSEPDADATLDKMFDEMAFKQNDSMGAFITPPPLYKINPSENIGVTRSIFFVCSNSAASFECAQQEGLSEQSMWNHCRLHV